jgi:hypothetical protein
MSGEYSLDKSTRTKSDAWIFIVLLAVTVVMDIVLIFALFAY